MDMPVQVPVDNPNADTEWNDILRSKGIIPPKPEDPEPAIQEALIEAKLRAHDNRLEDKTLDELDALEDLEDDDFLEGYRQKRLQEMNELSKASVFGHVYPLQKVDYARDVTEASNNAYVFVNLRSPHGDANVESRVLSEVFRELAVKFGDIKFCEIRADMCIEGYPEKNCPTILIYKDGNIQRQIITLRELNGPRTSAKDLEGVLVSVGAVKENDARIVRRNDEEDELEDDGYLGGRRDGPLRGLRLGVGKKSKGTNEEEDDDWD